MKIGILAVQGAFMEHELIMKQLGVPCIEIRQKADLDSIDGIILPGGESTVRESLSEALICLKPFKTKSIRDFRYLQPAPG